MLDKVLLDGMVVSVLILRLVLRDACIVGSFDTKVGDRVRSCSSARL